MITDNNNISREQIQRQFSFFVGQYRGDKLYFKAATTQDEIIKANNALMINGACAIVLGGLLGMDKEQIQKALGD